METRHRDLLLEMIFISDGKEITSDFFSQAINKMGGLSESISQINTILRWLDPFLVEILKYDLYRLSIYEEGVDNDYFIGKMQELFKYCPELNEIFVLNEKDITFNKSLSIEEIHEFRDFVKNNKEDKIKNVYIPKDKYK